MGGAVYRGSCPNCGGAISERRLAVGLPCERCLPEAPSAERSRVFEALRQRGTLGRYAELMSLEEKYAELYELFVRAVGNKPWGAQRSWIRRLARGDSFSIIAPTGTGKSTFGRVAAAYVACKMGGKVYVMVPTGALVVQEAERIEEIVKRIGCGARVVGYHSKARRSKRMREAVERGEYDILITTATLARKMAEILSSHRFSLMFVDDVDAAVKSGKTISAILRLAGFSSEAMEAGERLMRLQRKRARSEDVEELDKEIEGLRALVEEARKGASQLVISSATLKPRGLPLRLLYTFLGFTVGGKSNVGLRNVTDLYVITKRPLDAAVRMVKKLGPGTLVFVPSDGGVEKALRIASKLTKSNVKAEVVHAKTSPEVINKFEAGEIDVLVGVATPYGPLVRGLDMPQRIMHAVFVGPPRIQVSVSLEGVHPLMILRLLSLVSRADIPESKEASRLLSSLRHLRRKSAGYLEHLRDALERGESSDPLERRAIEALRFLRDVLKRDEVWKALARTGEVSVKERQGKKYILIADLATYLQASGRTSRLYGNSLTKGLSVVIVDEEGVFRELMRKTSYYDIEWKRVDEVDLERLKEEVRLSRERALEGEEIMRSALFVVESPNKARTIASFFGQPSERLLPGGLKAYEVAAPGYMLTIVASGGHVFDLVKEASPEEAGSSGGIDLFGVIVDGGYSPVLAPIRRCLSCGHQFTESLEACPRCGSRRIRDSTKTVEALRRLAWEVDEVLIATDPDTEGERIGWDLALSIMPYNLNIRRVEFHEVTKREVLRALQNPREFSRGLVEAQLVRRIEDRWIGFTLSPLLWCDFWPRYCQEVLKEGRRRMDSIACREEKYNYNLSAGRVQTPVLGWVIERERLMRKKRDVFSIIIEGDRKILEVTEEELGERAVRLRELAGSSTTVAITLTSREEERLMPPPPYATDSMIVDANRYLNMSAEEAMRLAQDLFEFGLITYHRTDSTRVSDKGIEIAREWISKSFPNMDLFEPRRWGEGGAHEAIRPTRPLSAEELRRVIDEGTITLPRELSDRHFELYDMIFRRFMASQMREAMATYGMYVVTVDDISIARKTIIGIGEGSERGYLHVWSFGVRERPLPVGTHSCRILRERRSKIGPITQGELVALMRERGIGRPSTYSKIVGTLLRRGYAIQVRRYIIPTSRGKRVYSYLTEGVANYWRGSGLEEHARAVPALVSERRTRELEEKMKLVEEGKEEWTSLLDEILREMGGLALSIRLAINRDVGGTGVDIAECIEGAKRVL